jgi:hypothetical protein
MPGSDTDCSFFSPSEPAKAEIVQLVQIEEPEDRYVGAVGGAVGGDVSSSGDGMSNPSYGQAIAV